uniref:Peptide Ctry2606 n=1 Tax=Chaerilus tryznai TaxID=1464547 RepID=NDB4V_CHATY|nr:RecName: Full=Peptide Ctry2606; Flags: Precursor [Chaerilus tryznai]
MKTQTALFSFFLVLLLVATQTEGGILDAITGLLGKRALRNQNFVDYAFDPSLSAADWRALETLLEEY